MPATRLMAFPAAMRRLVLALAVALLPALPATAQTQSRLNASIVVDSDTGEVLHAERADTRGYPASLTKVMTLYLLFEALDQGKIKLDAKLPVSARAAAQSPSKLHLKAGDRIGVEEAVLSLVTKSANDVAVVVAEAVGGTEEKFAEMMTRKARQLGMTQTTYRNASGLPNPKQVSTVRDQATLGRALVKNHGKHYHYFATRQFKWKGTPINGHNRLMARYDGADGIKTGYINASGFNLMASAKRDGRRIVGVVFGGNTATSRDNYMATLLDKGFARVKGIPDTRSANLVGERDKAELETLLAAARDINVDEELHGSGDTDPATWAIQVGAFSDAAPAKRAANSAAKSLGDLAAQAAIDINRTKQGGATLYRARLTGLTEDEARAACTRLKRAKSACAVIQPDA